MFFSVGKAVCEARKNAGMSVEDMVRLTGVSKRTIYRYENDTFLPSLDYIIQLSRICLIPTDELLGIYNEENCRYKP